MRLPRPTCRLPATLLRTAVACALATASANAAAAGDDDPPAYVTVELAGKGWAGENCEGGEWQLEWSGPVAVERGPLADLLNSYTAFDTTQSNQLELRPAKFRSTSVVCRDNHGNIGLRGNVVAATSSDVQVTVSLAQDASALSPNFIFTARDVAMCSVEGAGVSMEQPLMVALDSRSAASLSPAIELTLEDLQNGFDRSFDVTGSVIGAGAMCMGHEIASGSVRIHYKSGDENPSVALNACLHLAKGETIPVTAVGSPSGGTYRFIPAGRAFDVRSDGSATADVTGQNTGKGRVEVQYERNGRKARASVEGSVVEIVSINDGAPLPPLGLYDANGRLRSGARTFPLRIDPEDGQVTMMAVDDSIASVANTRYEVQVQPTKVGRTGLIGRTLCGTTLKVTAKIQVVRCDDDVKRELRAQQQQAKARVDQLVRRITQLTGSASFDEAASGIGESTQNMAVATGASIAGTLAAGADGTVRFATQRGIDIAKAIDIRGTGLNVGAAIAGVGDAMSTADASLTGAGDWQTQLKPALGAAMQAAREQATSIGRTYADAIAAAERFGRQLGTLAGVAEQLESLEPQLDEAVRELMRISTRLAYCEGAPSDAPPPSKPDTPKPTPKPKPTPPVEVEIETPTEIPVPQEPTPAPENPTPPSPQPEGQKVYGVACRVQDLRAPGVAQRLSALRAYSSALETSAAQRPATPADAGALEDFTRATIDTALARAAELKTLGGLTRDLKALQSVANAQAQQLEGAQAELDRWMGSIQRMNAATAAGEVQSRAAFAEFRRAYDDFVLGAGRRGLASIETMMETDECRDRLEVKIDQVRTRYN